MSLFKLKIIKKKTMKSAEGAAFQAKRIFTFATLSLIYALVFFQRTCPSIVAEEMAISYNCSKSDLSIFSSVFFYSYGAMQPFAGLLADIMEPSLLIGISQLTAGLGAIICGFSDDVLVGCIGRLLVGLGCGPVYVPECRCVANWFNLKLYPLMTGVLVGVGGVGGIIAQGPLAALNQAVGWRNSFYIIGGATFFFAIICLIFIKGNPVKLGYAPINPDTAESKNDTTLKQKFKLLFTNLIAVLKYPWFWLVAVFTVVTHGPYYNANGLWAGPFLRDVFGYDKQKTGNTLIFLSLGLIAGSICIPLISAAMKSRKWCLLLTTILAAGSSFVFFGVGPNMDYWLIAAMIFIFGAFTMPNSAVAYSLVREYYPASIAGSSVGCINFFTQITSGAFQSLSSVIIKSYGEVSYDVYTWEGYKMGLWLVSCVFLSLGCILSIFFKESEFVKKKTIEQPLIGYTNPDEFSKTTSL